MKRRILALIMTALMVFQTIPATAFAETADSTETAKTNAAQIGPYYEVESDGSLPATPTLDEGNNSPDVTAHHYGVNSEGNAVEGSTYDDVVVNKRISGTGEENKFKIDLTVTTKQRIEEPDMAVAFVVDVSTSMDAYYNTAQTQTRIQAAQEAMKNFVDEFGTVSATKTKRYIAITKFCVDASIVTEWVDVTTDEGKQKVYDYINTLHDGVGTQSGSTASNWGTNIEGGLLLGRNLLDDESMAAPIQGIDEKHVILLSDGGANSCVLDKNETTTFTSTDKTYYDTTDTSAQSYDGSWLYADYHFYHSGAIEAAQRVQSAGAELHTVYCGNTDDGITNNDYAAKDLLSGGPDCIYCEAERAAFDAASDYNTYKENSSNSDDYLWVEQFQPNDYKVTDFLTNISDEFVATTNSEDLLDNILKLAREIGEAWVVTDPVPMGNHIEFIDFENEGESYYYDEESGSISWDLKNVSNEDIEVNEDIATGITTYTYTVSYYIRLDNLYDKFSEETLHNTNKTTQVPYVISKTEESGDESATTTYSGTAYFNIPSVKGYTADLKFENAKLGQTEEGSTETAPLAGATFKITHSDDCTCGVTLDGNWSMTATSDANGTFAFTDIPSGHTYEMVEASAPTGYKASTGTYKFKVSYGVVTELSDSLFDENNQIVNEKVDIINIEGSKTWNDNNDAAGERPDSITVKLLKTVNGETTVVKEITVSSPWTYSFEGLPLSDESGNSITYSIEEESVDGYITTYDGYNIINTYVDEDSEYVGTKVWVDSSNANGNRPSNLAVELYIDTNGNGKVDSEDTKVKDNPDEWIKKGDTWVYKFTDLTMIDTNGNAIQYIAKEVALTEYDESTSVTKPVATLNSQDTIDANTLNTASNNTSSFKINGSGMGIIIARINSGGFNTFWIWTSKELTSAEKEIVNEIGEKTYSDFNANYSGYYTYTSENPATYTRYSQYGGTRTATVSNNGGTVSVTRSNDPWNSWSYGTINFVYDYTPGTTVLTNTEKTVDVSVTKAWEDNDNELTKRPGSLTMTLKNGSKTVTVVTLNADNNWTATVEDLPMYIDHTEVEYTWEEDLSGLQGIYESSSSTSGDATVVTNTLITKVDVPVEKVWEDSENANNTRPGSVTVKLFANDKDTEKTVTLDSDNSWAGTFKNLDKYDEDGKEIEYTLEEVAVPGYTTSVNGSTITNTLITTVDVPVEKVWNDNNNAGNTRPSDITVKLFANNTYTGKTVTLNAGNSWKGEFKDLDKYADGAEIVYTVKEVTVPGYSTEINGTTVTNTVKTGEETKYTSATVNKVDQDGNDLTGATFTLYNSAGEKIKTYTGGEFSISTKDEELSAYLPEVGGSTELTLKETVAPSGYDKSTDVYKVVISAAESTAYDEKEDAFITTTTYSVKIDGEKDIDVVNHKQISVSGTKVWDDHNNEAGVRPSKITVNLYGTYKTDDTTYYVTRTEAGDYQTNTTKKAFATKEFSGDSIAASWKYEFTNLPESVNGNPITWTVTEVPIMDGDKELYSTTVDGYTITNSYPAKVNIPVEKTWSDGNDQDGLRPEKITIKLLANNADYKSQEITPDDEGLWKYTFKDLPKYDADDKVIEYTVEEIEVDGYTTIISGSVSTGFTIANTHTPAVTDITVNKEWNDAENQDGIRPTSVTVQLYKNVDGTKTAVGEAVTLSGTDWSNTWNDLPVNEGGKEILYSVEESVPDGYEVSYSEITNGVIAVTNSHTPETTSISGTKTWDDNNNQDGIRPAKITVNLYGTYSVEGTKYYVVTNNNKLSATTTETEYAYVEVEPNVLNNWNYEFTALPQKYAGNTITWSVTDSVNGYTSVQTEGTYDIVNSHTPAVKNISVTKVWNDESNRDNIRPDSVTVQLKANGVNKGEAVVLSNANQWSHTWENLPEKSAGTDIVYTVVETDVPAGYTVEVNGSEENGFTVTNKHIPETTSATVKKVWDDKNNQDGKRPESLTVTLSNGQSVTLDDDNDWTAIVENLPKYKTGEVGQLIDYTWTEGDMPEGYTLTNTTVSGVVTTLTNSYNTETTSATIKKVWSDGNNQDGLRPAEITVELLADGVETGKTVTLNASNNWETTIEDLDAYAGGQKITYAWSEVSVPDGYTTSASTNGTIKTITNSYTPEVTEATVTKVWIDNENQDGIRPASVKVQLLANGKAEGEPVDVTAANGWTYTWTGLAKKANGADITYTVEEVGNVTGYTSSAEGMVITNTHEPEKTSVEVVKVWSDSNNQDGKRPGSLNVQLKANGEVLAGKAVTLSDSNNWRATIGDLPKYANGQLINYTWAEETLPEGYALTSADISTDANGKVTTTLVNTYKPEETSATVKKVWSDSNNQDGKRPASITATLSNGTSVTLNEANGWTATVENLPVYANGTAIEYTWTESGVPEGYTLTGTSKDGVITTLTNSYTPETTQATIKKVWNDNDDQDGKRPENLTVTLSDGQSVTLNEQNGWQETITGLPKYANGVEIDYTWTEPEIDGYTLEGSVENGTLTTLTNKHVPETTAATVTKVWSDADNQDGKRPTSLKVDLMNGKDKVGEVTLNADNGWTASIDNLPVYANGQEITYAWSEDTLPEGYELTGTAVEGVVTTLTNTDEPDVREATVKKVWDDADDQDGKRPEELKVYLMNGDDKVGEVTLNEGNSWTATITGLAVNKNGEAIEYTWSEGKLPEGYTLSGTSTNGTITTLTNSYTPETTEATVKKIWDDADNQDGKRPASITAILSNGMSVVLNEGNNWTAKIENLPKYADGKEIKYTWTESKLSDGYKLTDTSAKGTVTSLTNSYTPETIDISGSKTWTDEDDRDGLRPSEITIKLLADGEKVAEQTVTAENGWSWAFEDQPKYRDGGTEIEYTITEDEVDDYTTDIDGYNATNTHTPEKTTISGTKTWNDADNQDGKRPESVTIRLLADGTVAKDSEGNDITATVTAADNWSYKFENLNKFRDHGVEIVYTITEDAVPEYTTKISGTNVTNSYTPGQTSVTVTKAWDDGSDQDGIRPDYVTVQLYADNVAYGEAVELEAAKNWTYTWNGLAQKKAGKDIKYTVQEVGSVTGYTVVTPIGGDQTTGYIIKNEHTPETTEVKGTKTWSDNNNQDGKRPESVTINLLADGEKVAEQTVTAANGWNWTFEDLPKYRDGGTAIVYTVTENPITDTEGKVIYSPTVDGYNITNTYSPETVNIDGTKTWSDADNQDGKRPVSITVNLLADGVLKDSKTVTAENGWKYSFTNLPKYRNGGTEIVYTITENVVSDYTASSNGFNLINSHTPLTTEINGTKTWSDADNQDGMRPESITVNLLADGKEVAEQTVTADNGWNYSFTNLPVFSAGKLIEYTITEDKVDGYNATVNGANITNSHTPETVAISGTKTWSDANDQDGMRPESITVRLLADGEEIDHITVTEDDGWAYDFGNLPKYRDGGIEIVYTITEDAVENYTTATNGYDVVNSHTPEKTEVKGEKTWNDNDDQDGVRPESITINLLANGQKIDSATVTAEDGWKWEFTDLDKYSNGTEIVYTVQEEEIEGYTTKVEGYDVINTYAPEQTSVNGVKTWLDGGDQDGIRPDSITVRLLADGTEVDSADVTAEDNWAWSFTDLPKYRDGGTEIVYTITEDAVDGYDTTVNGNNITNTRTPETIEISGSKTWVDADDQDGARPEYITVRLLADGKEVKSATVTAEDNWAWNFTDLPKYKAGTEIVYTITEDKVEGYEATVDGFDVTNTHEIQLIDIGGTKTWDDADDQDGMRPESITVRLLADGKEVASTEVTAAGGWTYSFTDLPKYREGKVGEEIVYTITEDKVVNYTASIDGFNVKNIHIPETVVVEGVKTWDDANDQDDERPEKIKINLLADGEKIADKTVSAKNGWAYQFTNLPKFKDGELIVYTVTEDAISGYTPDENTSDFNIENTHTPGKTSVSVSKVWDDSNDQDGLRPESIDVNLLADGDVKETVTLNEANDWSYTWIELDEKAAGEEIVYTVKEAADIDGYDVDITGNAVDGYTITNEHTPATVDLNGAKTWSDADDQDGKRPESITINLLANGVQVDTVTVSEEDGWDWSFKNKPEYENGEKIVYVIQEVVIDDYTTSIKSYDVTNTHIPETTSVHVAKHWADDNDRDGIRPASITINLLADGEVVQSQTTTLAEDWAVEFTELPVYKDGKKIVYTVEEAAIDGYTASYTENNENNFTVSNIHEVEKTSVKGKKIWKDNFDQDGKRPDAITVYLLANGEKVDSKVVTADDNWKWEFTDLNKNEGGEEITYTVIEMAVPNYASEVNGNNIINTYVPETVDISGTKTWNDADDQDGKRPVSIVVRLMADGKEVASKTVTEATDWTYTFENMPKYRNGGVAIVYTVAEDAVAEYTTEIDGYNVTNTHDPETVDINGTKTWVDEDDQDGVRPESITINLLANGEKVDSKVVTADDDWSWSFSDLPKYKDGKLISYATAEVSIEDYSTVINKYDVTNTHTPEQTSVSVSKSWNDAGNQDGIRPEGIKVQLLADGSAVDTVVLSADNSWAYTWSELDMYDDGEAIEYEVREVDVPAGYNASITGDAVNGYVVTNTHDPATVTVDGTKVWADVNDQDGKRPETITILLLKNGIRIDSMTISEANDWTWEFTDLPKYEGGSEIIYQIEEVVIPDYETSIDQNTGTVTNRHDPELTYVQVAKSWQDNYDQDGIRPDKITVNLLADGKKIDSKIVTAADEWATEFTNLPKYKDGELIEYTITEDKVKGYETDYVTYKDYLVIVNTHEPETTAVSGTKTWDDANDQDGKRPDEIIVNLYADGVKADEMKVTGSNGWTYSFDNLPKYKNGAEIEYTVTETPVEGYQTTIDGYDITNSYEPERVSVKGTKSWNDEDDQDGKRPESITVQLRVNGQVWDSKEVTAADGWTYEWTDLSKYYNGKEVKYTVTEKAIPGYTATHDGYNITNTYIPGTVSVHVTKAWKDLNDLDGIRPESVEVELYADGEATGQTVELNEENGWHNGFDGLDEYKDGELIQYTVKEINVEDGYTAVVSGSVEEGFTILNTHEPEQVEISGTKTWSDADDQDGKRPAEIKVTLLANGTAVDNKVVTAADNWSYSFGKLNKYYNGGKEIKYEVVESAVAGYESEVDGFDIVNTHEPATKDISGTKTWDDNFDQDGMRPDSITVKLLADGEVAATETVTEKDGWSWTFEDLPVYKDGKVIEYTVEEAEVEGYEAVISGYDITNIHEPATTEITGTKTWDDADDQDGIRPESVTVRLLADGEEVAVDIVDADDNWTWFFEDLPVYDDGEIIKYTVEEESVDGYKAFVNGYDITNTHEPETTDISGSKTWDDADDQDGSRPASITVNLLADGEVTESVTVTAANGWEWIFEDLPVYADGEKIEYTISENPVDGYETVIDGYDIINTHEPEDTPEPEPDPEIQPAECTIAGTKVLEGEDVQLTEGQFQFGLYDTEGNLLDTASNDENGAFSFGEITYDAEGTFTYIVKEIIPEEAEEFEPGQFQLDGIVYDTAAHEVTVTVALDGSQLTAVADKAADEIVFVNVYSGGGDGDEGGDEPGGEDPTDPTDPSDDPTTPSEPAEPDPTDPAEPAEPTVTPTDPTDRDPLTETDKDGATQTGDDSHMMIYLIIALMALAVAVTTVKGKKENE